MAGTIDSLYLKYCNRVQRFMENDTYYQYLLELIADGKTTVTQLNRVLDKKVDEKWLKAVEDTIPSIHEIIAHPKRFIKTIEEIAPVEKVKKIGPDTVQHLSSHTQFISGMRGDTIYPEKLLTVQNEESFDLYENRFVNTLIRKLSEFIEKRTSALFWDTNDEQYSLLRMDSALEDDYERVEYKLELTVHNKQTYLENDASKIDVFKRIDRVRRVVSDFRQSAFCATMADTSPVRSPIQRTNQITKNPDYRKCYDLWQFLERYDQVGYEVDIRETALDFDEDYLFQMYGNMALNYTVFKSLLEHDTRRITEAPKRRKNVKPKFIKQIVEEFVDDYDLPDVEIRQVIIEEVTKAQMEIDRRTKEQLKSKERKDAAREKEKLAKEKEREKERLAKEKEKAKLAAQKAKEKETERLATQKAKEAEKAKLAKEKEREKARLAKEKEKEREKERLVKEKEKEKARIAREKEQEKARLAKEKEADKLAAQPKNGKQPDAPKPAAKKPKPAAAKPKPVVPSATTPESEGAPTAPAGIATAVTEAATAVPEVIAPPAAMSETVSADVPAPEVKAKPAAKTKSASAPKAAKPKAPAKPKKEPVAASRLDAPPSEEPTAEFVPAPIENDETSAVSAPEPITLSEPSAPQEEPEPPAAETLPEEAPAPEMAAAPEPETVKIPEPAAAPTPAPQPASKQEPAATGNPLLEWIQRRRKRNKSQ